MIVKYISLDRLINVSNVTHNIGEDTNEEVKKSIVHK
jgi:hypothetical protein